MNGIDQKMIDLRGKVLRKEALTEEETRYVVEALRQNRFTATATAAKKPKKEKGDPATTDKLLSDLGL